MWNTRTEQASIALWKFTCYVQVWKKKDLSSEFIRYKYMKKPVELTHVSGAATSLCLNKGGAEIPPHSGRKDIKFSRTHIKQSETWRKVVISASITIFISHGELVCSITDR